MRPARLWTNRLPIDSDDVLLLHCPETSHSRWTNRTGDHRSPAIFQCVSRTGSRTSRAAAFTRRLRCGLHGFLLLCRVRTFARVVAEAAASVTLRARLAIVSDERSVTRVRLAVVDAAEPGSGSLVHCRRLLAVSVRIEICRTNRTCMSLLWSRCPFTCPGDNHIRSILKTSIPTGVGGRDGLTWSLLVLRGLRSHLYAVDRVPSSLAPTPPCHRVCAAAAYVGHHVR